ncbi:unnamed protein product [Notodromas monacha]|uniref:Splicing factor YJU2 n=1 Tax=Notodromas monacha TaxID=399045 RepID=A0A7R9BNX3_9CRUS|nr:unnamed protein product [Notodromas monacha]CAG0918957.1 unnamed protein product [Notodromas monacha]
MSERKVLNKYYPPDFDPSKIPRMRLPKNRKFCVRLMAPCNMRCDTCGEYIYKGKKFNARKEDVDNMSYLGIRIYRFYIKCTRCLSEISFRTDPEATDYVLEAGATRNFQALKLAEEAAEREEAARLEEEKNNPMKARFIFLLEKRTQQSKYEMDMLETLEELKELNQRQGASLDESLDQMLRRKAQDAAVERETEDAQDELVIASAFGHKNADGERIIRRLDSYDSDEEAKPKKVKVKKEADDLLFKRPAACVASKPEKKPKLSLGVVKKASLVKPKKSSVSAPPPKIIAVAAVPPVKVKAEPVEKPELVSTKSVPCEKSEEPTPESSESVPTLALPNIQVPSVASSFEKGLTLMSEKTPASSSNGLRGAGFYNPFGAYGSGSSDDSDSD